MGEHTAEVLHDWLGLDDEATTALRGCLAARLAVNLRMLLTESRKREPNGRGKAACGALGMLPERRRSGRSAGALGPVGRIDTNRCPLSMLTGEYDSSCTVESSEATMANIAGIRFQPTQRSDLSLFAENPKRFPKVSAADPGRAQRLIRDALF